MTGTPYSEAERAYLRAHPLDPIKELAATLGRSEASVSQQRGVLGIRAVAASKIEAELAARDERLRVLVRRGLSNRQIANVLGIGRSLVSRDCARLGLSTLPPPSPELTPDQKAEITDLRRRGWGINRISAHMGRRCSRVEAYIEEIDRDPELSPSAYTDRAFVAKLNAVGGMPRAEVTPEGTVWLGVDNRLWSDPDRRRAAA